MWIGCQRRDPPALPPGKSQYQFYSRLGEPQGRSGRLLKNLAATRMRSPQRPALSDSLCQQSNPGPPPSLEEQKVLKRK
jgi:hypothetical protein